MGRHAINGMEMIDTRFSAHMGTKQRFEQAVVRIRGALRGLVK